MGHRPGRSPGPARGPGWRCGAIRALVNTLAQERRHPALPGVELPPSVRPLADPGEAFKAPIWISALPTQITPGSGPTWPPSTPCGQSC